jgi:hypothetical protein
MTLKQCSENSETVTIPLSIPVICLWQEKNRPAWRGSINLYHTMAKLNRDADDHGHDPDGWTCRRGVLPVAIRLCSNAIHYYLGAILGAHSDVRDARVPNDRQSIHTFCHSNSNNQVPIHSLDVMSE